MEASSSLGDEDKLPGYEKDPNEAVKSLIKSSLSTSFETVIIRAKQFKNLLLRGQLVKKLQRKTFKGLALIYYSVLVFLSKSFGKLFGSKYT